MTVEDIEAACDARRELDFSRHELEAPELTLREVFYPLGFPMVLKTNSEEILHQARELWSMFEQRFDTTPIRVDVHVSGASKKTGPKETGPDKSQSVDCPPAPTYTIMQPLLLCVADTHNMSIANLAEQTTQLVIARSTARYKSYVGYFFLQAAVMCHIATQFATPVHAGCVALNGHGMLLCGDSGAGKSTLSYACARAGWDYVTDDASLLLNGFVDGATQQEKRIVTGNCKQMRFRPSAAELFPEIRGLAITPRAAGKPSIELPTEPMQHIRCVPTAQVDYLVFLNRRSPHTEQELRPYREDVARAYLRQVLFGPADSLVVQYAALDRLLTAKIFELRYTDLHWAVNRLALLAKGDR